MGLSFFSIAFDLLFIFQHYVLYPQKKLKTVDTVDEIEYGYQSLDTDDITASQKFKYVKKIFSKQNFDDESDETQPVNAYRKTLSIG